MKKIIRIILKGFMIMAIPAVLIYLALAFIFLDLSWVVEHYIIRGIYGFATAIWSVFVLICAYSAYNDSH